MTKNSCAFLVAIVIATTGCAPREDSFATSDAGYVQDARAIVDSTDWSKAQIVEVGFTEYEFSPAKLTFRRSVPYRVILHNTGDTTHYFVSDGFFRAIAARTLITASGEIESPRLQSVAVPPGAQKEILLVPVKTGTYALECTAPFHSSFGMSGTITIQ